MKSVHLWPEEKLRRGPVVTSAINIEIPGRERQRLWYEVPQEHEGHVSEGFDHLLTGVAFLTMQVGLDVRFHGQISPSLLRNLAEFRAAWAAMLPGLADVEVGADTEREAEAPSGRKGALVAFSGGVDSAFTAFRHVRAAGIRHPREVSGAVMVHGFDIPVGERDTFVRALERSRRMVCSLGLEIIPIATNHRDVVGDWPHSHGAAVASTLALLGGGFREGLIGQTFTYAEIRQIAEGVNALTDPLLSSDSFRIIPDGAAFERADKIRALGDWPEFLRDARVCWQGPRKDQNCCVCEKCVRNILTFRALGLGLPACFPQDVSDEQIRNLNPGEETRAEIRYAGLGRLAAESGASGEWIRILEWRLKDTQRAQRSRLYRAVRRVRSALRRRLLRTGMGPRKSCAGGSQ